MAEVDDTPLPGAPRPAPTSYAEALHEVHGSIEDTLLASDTPTMKVVKDDAPVAISGREETLVGGSAVAGVRREMPAKIGRYMVIAPLGEGGMGVVFAAYDPQLDRKVAIKLVRPAYTETSGGEAQARLVREAQALARLRHPNIVTVYEVGTFGDEVYVAMELVDGVTLRTWQFEHARSWRDIVRVYTAAGRGLAAAHRTGLVHRDFKPDNVLVARDGEARVLDFGLAYRENTPAVGEAAAAPVDEALTMTGALVGTPAYMAPEQFKNGAVDARTDVFAFCVALHEALYGVRPFAGTTVAEICVALFEGQITPPPPFLRVPAWLRRVVLRGLKLDPGERPASMDELLRALGRDPARYLVGASVALVVGGVIAALVLALRTAEGRETLRDHGARVRADFNEGRVRALEAGLLRERERDGAARFNAWVVEAARARLGSSPAAALAALKHLRRDGGGWTGARGVAAEAVARGVAAATWPTDAPVTALSFAGGDRWLVTGDARGRLEVRAREGGAVVASVESGAAIAGLAAVAVTVARGDAGPSRGDAGPSRGDAGPSRGDAGPSRGDAGVGGPALRVAAVAGGALLLWDVADGTLRRRDDAPALAVALAADGERVAFGADDGRLRVVAWSGEVRHDHRGHAGPVRALVWSQDGARVATGGDDGRVIAWNLAANTRRELAGPGPAVLELRREAGAERLFAVTADFHAAALALDGASRAAAGTDVLALRSGADARLQVDARGGVSLRHDGAPDRRLALAAPARAADLDPAGRWAAIAHARGLELWDARARRDRALPVGGLRIDRLTWSRGGAWLAGATDAGGVTLWRVDSGARTVLRAAGPPLSTLFFAADDAALIVGDHGPRLTAWDLAQDPPAPRELPLVGARLPTIQARPLADGGVLQWHQHSFVTEVQALSATGERRWSTPTIDNVVLAELSADGRRLALTSQRDAELWRVDGATPVREAIDLGGPDHRWRAVAHTPDSARTRLAAALEQPPDATAGFVVWEVAWTDERPTAHVLHEDDDARAVLVEPGGAAVVVLAPGSAHLWNLVDGRVDLLPRCIAEVRGFALAGDGRRVALVGGDRVGSVSEVACFVDLERGEHHRLDVRGDPWAWDGRRSLASVYRGTELDVWTDPSPEDPDTFMRWLAAQTRRELSLAALVGTGE